MAVYVWESQEEIVENKGKLHFDWRREKEKKFKSWIDFLSGLRW